MDEIVLLTSLTLFTLLAGVCSIVFNKLRLPPLIGYLMAGILIANIWDVGEDAETVVSMLSDMGLIMLMFCIGMEINLKKIRKQGVFAIEVAVIQLPLMVLGGFIGGTLLGFDMVQSIALGAIISGSSTAVVMAVLRSQGQLDKEHIEMLVLITIMEDIGQVIMLSMITPVLAGAGLDTNGLIVMIVSIFVFMIVSIVAGLRVVPKVINWISDNVSSEILTIISVGLAFGMALLGSYVGLSTAIGAFLMGMMVASSRKSKEIIHDVEPMKNLFMSMFFISVGMEISVFTLWDNILLILIIYAMFACLKTSTVFLGYWVGNEKGRNGFVSAIGLVAMGEFAFIIAKEALDYGVVDSAFYTSVIGAALISMIILPLLTKNSGAMWDKASEKCPPRLMMRFERLNAARDDLYARISATSRRSRKGLVRSLTHSYVDVLIMAAIEILFYLGMPPATEWLIDAFGGNNLLWGFLLLVVNFIVLSIPATMLVNNAKYFDELVIRGAKMISNREGIAEREPARVFQLFLAINSYIIAMAITMVIVTIVPNPLPIWAQLLVFVVGMGILAAIQFRNRKEEPSEGSDEESVPEQAVAPKKRRIGKPSLKMPAFMGIGRKKEEPAPAEPEASAEDGEDGAEIEVFEQMAPGSAEFEEEFEDEEPYDARDGSDESIEYFTVSGKSSKR